MSNIKTNKVLSFVLVLAMVCSLLCIPALANDENQSTYSPEVITDLNTIRNDLSGDYKLDPDLTSINIDAASWAAIGTSSAPFTGTFDGSGVEIIWSGSKASGSYYGIFGSSSGTIANVKATGTLTLTGSGSYVSPIVGYSSGNVYNCTSSVALTATSMDNVGGIVGAMEDLSTSEAPIYIQASGNTGSIKASKRVGGVVGAVYCNVRGNAIVDQCYSKNCTIQTTTTSSKVWSGGLAGYVKGGITHSYTNNISLIRAGGRYLSGLVGILNGSNPAAYAEDCYANVVSYGGSCSSGYDRPFVGSCDSSAAVTLDHCYFTEISPFNQPTGSSWGTWTNSAAIDSSWSNLSLNTTYFSSAPGASPTLLIEAANKQYAYTFGDSGSGGGEDESIDIYLNGTITTEGYVGNGSVDTPYNSLSDALTAVTTSGGDILISGAVTLSGTQTLNNNVTFKRASGYNDEMFNVTSGTVTLTTMTIDGGIYTTTTENGEEVTTVTPTGTLFNVTGGNLRLRGNVTLTNAVTAVNVAAGGTLTVNKANITGSTNSIVNAGTVTLEDYGGTTISGDIYLANSTYITVMAALPAISISLPTGTAYATIASGTNSYALSSTDEGNITCSGYTKYRDETNNMIYAYTT